jgi:hypothetical protein
LECDRLQHDRPVACVIAQQYFSVSFVSLHFLSHKESFGAHLSGIVCTANGLHGLFPSHNIFFLLHRSVSPVTAGLFVLYKKYSS